MGYNSFDTEFKRAMSSTKETLKALINKLGGTVENEQITDFPALVDGIEIAGDATDISYSNTSSGLTATDVQSAIDEVYSKQRDADTLEGHPASYFATADQIKNFGKVKTVVGVSPDAGGNVPLTAADVGAAPGGFGLGEGGKFITSSEDLNNITSNGWYYFDATPANAPTSEVDGWPGGYSYMLVTSRNQNDVTQIIFANNQVVVLGCVLKRHSTTSGWSPWEWVNPPMQLGVEYRTTERYNGNPVYVKLIDLGEAVDNKQVSTGITSPISVVCQANFGSYSLQVPQMPFQYASGNLPSKYGSAFYLNTSKIILVLGASCPAHTAVAIIKYTKE